MEKSMLYVFLAFCFGEILGSILYVVFSIISIVMIVSLFYYLYLAINKPEKLMQTRLKSGYQMGAKNIICWVILCLAGASFGFSGAYSLTFWMPDKIAKILNAGVPETIRAMMGGVCGGFGAWLVFVIRDWAQKVVWYQQTYIEATEMVAIVLAKNSNELDALVDKYKTKIEEFKDSPHIKDVYQGLITLINKKNLEREISGNGAIL